MSDTPTRVRKTRAGTTRDRVSTTGADQRKQGSQTTVDNNAEVIRSHRFATVPEQLLRDTSISFGAKGLYAFIATLPSSAPLTINYLAEQSPAGPHKTRTLYHELQETGWLSVERWRDEKGQWRQRWALLDTPRPEWKDEAKAS
ncbi:hypothetical protein [Amycolatopsis sp. WAC 04197]|uniref:hypothetical protein n=1 Tax=Amycolatopsis sp. WAC 04197 TaxID=2203199 RepID=UPI000F77D79F|nr:hypothetical protein [Amycolatopsis sp. WAC 04197]